MSSQSLSGGPNPFLAAGNFIGNQYRKGIREQESNLRADLLAKTLSMHEAHYKGLPLREKPTPANTGAPVPGYRKRGPITPSTTGAPMPGTLKDKTSIHPTTGAKVTPVPVKAKSSKPTPSGTKPKKK
jgi:hypothetical protein